MTFRETLTKHLRAIRERDLESLMETVSPDELTLIMSDGKVVRSAAEFARLHRSWFESPSWALDVSLVTTAESPSLAVATLLLGYRDDPEGGPPVRGKSLLSLVFALRDGSWLMIQDQNTPIQAPEEGGRA